MSFLDGLNTPQRKAVLYGEGPLLVIAGAGSGKTRVLTHRIAHLIRHEGVSPWSILAITFTNKAADEMRNRVGDLLGASVGRRMWICTFHSACVRILRAHAQQIGYDPAFSIYDSTDAQRLVAMCIKDQGLDPKRFTPRGVLADISTAKNELLSPAQLKEVASTQRKKLVAEVFALYEQRLREANAMDFDDLLVRTVELLRLCDDARKSYADRFSHVLVDEYQDTNRAQYELSKQWSSGTSNLCVVGDSDQSIYGFRGADIRNILGFERDFPDAAVIALEQNYRSTQHILDAANALIRNNATRNDKQLFTEHGAGDPIFRYEAADEHDEASYVCAEIETLVGEHGYLLGEIAVFYRTNAQSRVLEEALMRAGIGYRVIGSTRFYDRREIKDALAYLRLLVNPADEVSLRRIINVPRRGIGAQTLDRLAGAAVQAGLPLGEMIWFVDEIPNISPRARAAVQGFCEVITDLRTQLAAGGIEAAVQGTWELTGYAAELRAEHTHEADGRLENLTELLSVAQDFLAFADDDDAEPLAAEDVLRAFLEQVSLVSDVDDLPDADDLADSSVTLMTVHNAKGLEYPVVFIVGLEEGVFPHVRSLTERRQIEEERRLAYVGVTRAKERLYLTNAVYRSMWGKASWNTISRFLYEIPQDLVRVVAGGPDAGSWGRGHGSPAAFGGRGYRGVDRVEEPAGTTFGRGCPAAVEHSDVPAVTFAVGDRVRHTKFGDGTVAEITGQGDQAVGVVRFDATPGTSKNMMLAPHWLRLEKI